MRRSLLRTLATAALCLSSLAAAQSDPLGLGSGQDGPLVVTSTRTINTLAALLADRSPGDTTLPVASAAGFSPGDVVLVWQTTGGEAALPADTSPLDLGLAGAGRYELVRLANTGGGALTLSAPLRFGYAASRTQLVRLPQHTDVTIAPDAGLTAAAWNGVLGGVVGFLATGTVTLDGVVDASGAGFRSGSGTVDTSGDGGCEGFDEPEPFGAGKGEGLVGGGPTGRGRGNLANGGGGGVCFRSGGGGGGSAGRGGRGGNATDNRREVGGLGGAALWAPHSTHLFLGGGGGAGHASVGSPPRGGRGGGVVFIRAGTVSGSGAVLAQGSAGQGSGADGCGGGGAGGTVVLQVTGTLACGSLSVTGGNGGTAGDNFRGPGGGGAGGLIAVSAQDASGCPFDFAAGIAGTHPGFGNPGPYGALPLTRFDAPQIGRSEVACPVGSSCVPAGPDGGVMVDGGASFVSAPRDDAECGSPYRYDDDDLPTLSEPGPWTFDVVPVPGGPVPQGLTVAPETGAIEWVPEARQRGEHHFRLRATQGSVTVTQDLTVRVYCSQVKEVGCACGAGSSELLVLLALTALRASRGRGSAAPGAAVTPR